MTWLILEKKESICQVDSELGLLWQGTISLCRQCCYVPIGFNFFLFFNVIKKKIYQFFQYRAIYHGSDIIMLDDVLSAVDTQVARWILFNAILGPLMKQTRVLCTHNVQVSL